VKKQAEQHKKESRSVPQHLRFGQQLPLHPPVPQQQRRDCLKRNGGAAYIFWPSADFNFSTVRASFDLSREVSFVTP
jgi:hypothetical protein